MDSDDYERMRDRIEDIDPGFFDGFPSVNDPSTKISNPEWLIYLDTAREKKLAATGDKVLFEINHTIEYLVEQTKLAPKNKVKEYCSSTQPTIILEDLINPEGSTSFKYYLLM